MDKQLTNKHMNAMSDNNTYEEYIVEVTGDGEDQQATSSTEEYRFNNVTSTEPGEIPANVNANTTHRQHSSRISSNKHLHQNIVDTNDLMMISVNKITQHRYVLTDDEVEQSLQELDDTVASLDGGGGSSSKHHRRTHTASSKSSFPSGNTAASTGFGDFDTASLTSRTCSVLTEKSHAVLMHRHLIDNMEKIGYSNSHHYRNSSYKRTKNNERMPGGGKSISSRNSTTSRRSKISTAQQSYTSQRTNRRPRGPSLERSIFQTLLHTARSDVAGAHFVTSSPTHLGENGDCTIDETMEKVKATTQKEEEDFSVELILKDLIQADAVLSVEVGDADNRSLDKIDNSHVTTIGDMTVTDERSLSNGSKNQLLLLPPIATEEEPELLFPITATAIASCASPVDMRSSNQHQHFLPQPEMEEGEWQPDFDAIEFPTAPYTKGDRNVQDSSANTTNDTIASSFLQQSQKEVSCTPTTTTTMSISPNHEPHSSNEDSPESDIFDQIDDSGYYNYQDEGAASLLFHDETEIAHFSPTTDGVRQNTGRGIDPPGSSTPRGTIPKVPIVQPRVKLYDTANSSNAMYYEIDASHDEIASWGFDEVAPVIATETNHYYNSSGKLLSTDVVPITPPTISNTVKPNDTHNKSLAFPIILQEEEGYKSAIETTDTPLPIKNAQEAIEWTSFDVNPFASDTGTGQDQQLSFSLSPIQLQQNGSATVDNIGSDHQPHRVHEVLSDTTSQDNVSVSSPASVVQFVQMVDRCPSNKSDTNNVCTFDTKCSF